VWSQDEDTTVTNINPHYSKQKNRDKKLFPHEVLLFYLRRKIFPKAQPWTFSYVSLAKINFTAIPGCQAVGKQALCVLDINLL
jgi:hypothetical protein